MAFPPKAPLGAEVEFVRIIRGMGKVCSRAKTILLARCPTGNALASRGRLLLFTTGDTGGHGETARLPGRALALLFRAGDLQVVVDRESAGHTLSADVDQILVALAVDHTFQRHVAILDDNSNRFLHT